MWFIYKWFVLFVGQGAGSDGGAAAGGARGAAAREFAPALLAGDAWRRHLLLRIPQKG